VHPDEREDGREVTFEELVRMAQDERVVAIGETGLDYFRDYAPREAQRRLFERLLAVATDARKPVVVHTRAADEDTLAALSGFAGTVVLHCFSSTDLLPAALERGYYVSFAGNATYPKAADLRTAAARIPVDRILAETDAPYLAPQPVRGRPNEPANVVHTLASLAEARGEEAAVLEQAIEANAAAAFRLT
jgi:TatD DNase family protein